MINLGGGLGIDYTHKEPLPGPMDMVDAVRGLLAGRNLSIILEPGRSMVANTGVLVRGDNSPFRNLAKREASGLAS